MTGVSIVDAVPPTLVKVKHCSRCNLVTASETRIRDHILTRSCPGGAHYYTEGR